MPARPMRHHQTLLFQCPWWLRRFDETRWQPDGGHTRAERWADVSCPWCCSAHRASLSGQSHRRRPLLPPQEPGCCRLCRAPLPPRRRSWCSDACANLWFGASSSPWMTHHLVELLGRECWACGARGLSLELDHIRPLWSLDDDERLEPRWWLPFNLQLLCLSCHKAKTKREAAERAALRRAAAG